MEVKQNLPEPSSKRQRLGSPGREMHLNIDGKIYSPKHSEYIDFAARKDTFNKSWPREKEHLIEDLCKAGLFHSGPGDKCVCFYCDGSLEDWDEDDDPWWEHCKVYYRCPYILATKGSAYVRKVGSTLTKSEIIHANNMLYNGAKIHPGLFDPTRQKTALAAANLDSPSDDTNELAEVLNIMRVEAPKHPDFQIKQHRIESFNGRSEMDHLVIPLADVGFFWHEKKPDHVACYHCNVSTKLSDMVQKGADQIPDPLPELWSKHFKLNPWCYYVLQMKRSEVKEFFLPILKEMTASQKQEIWNSDCQKCSFDHEIDPTDVEMDSAGCSLSDEQKAAMSANLDDIIRKDPEERTPEEIEILRIRTTCFNCHSRKSVVVCLPCGCLCLCLVCQYSHRKYCPRCSKIIKQTIRTYLS